MAMKTRMLLVAALAAVSLTAGGQSQKAALNFNPVSCIKGGELALLQVDVIANEKAELRAYFRRVNTTDWCSVEGVNEGPLSRVVLPKFETGDEIEYFFVLLEGRRVVHRSPRMYRSSVTADCQSPFARHVIKIAMNCGQNEAAIPGSVGAGMAMTQSLVDGDPPTGSPDTPENPPN
jgi:hypothetical protein